MRAIVEMVGLALLTASAFTVNVTVGLAVAGAVCVFAANFAGEPHDDDVAERDADEPVDPPTVDAE